MLLFYLHKRLKSFLMLLMVVVPVLNSEQNYFKTNLKYVIGIPKCFLHDIILSIEIFSLRYPSFMSHFVHLICSKTHWTRDTDWEEKKKSSSTTWKKRINKLDWIAKRIFWLQKSRKRKKKHLVVIWFF